MAKAWLSLGANIGDPKAQLAAAVTRLKAHPELEVTAQSAIITTPPWGKTDQNDFENMALELETDSSPEALLAICQQIEIDLGRVRTELWGPRLIDIDLIAYDRVVQNAERLTLPHPLAHERDFVLTPLREIAPKVADWLIARAGNTSHGGGEAG